MTNLDKVKAMSVEEFLKQAGFKNVDAECIRSVLEQLDDLTCFGKDRNEFMCSCHFCNANAVVCNSDSDEIDDCYENVLAYLNSEAKE